MMKVVFRYFLIFLIALGVPTHFSYCSTLNWQMEASMYKGAYVVGNNWFCSSKYIDQLEDKVNKNTIEKKDFYLLFYLLNNPNCNSLKKLDMSRVLFKMIRFDAKQFASTFNSSPTRIKEKVLFHLTHPVERKSLQKEAYKALVKICDTCPELSMYDLEQAVSKGLLLFKYKEYESI